MSAISYRNATPADAANVAGLARRTFSETFGHLYDPADLAAFLAGHNQAGWAAELADPRFRVRIAEQESEPIAYAKIGPPSLPFEPRGPSMELRQLYVLKPWHGLGVGEALMRWAIAEAKVRDTKDLYLSVFVENARARRFYERHGFEVVGTYAFKVGNHADEDHVMRLTLEN